MSPDQVIALIEAHAPYMSEENEDFIINQSSLGIPEFDAADLAVRTCRCGFKIDGFDEYVYHLKDVFRGNT